MVDQGCIAFPDPDRPPFTRGSAESVSSNTLLTSAASPASPDFSDTAIIQNPVNVTSASVLESVRDDLGARLDVQ